MFSKVKSIGIFGIESYMIEVEADISGGLPCFDIVGLPDAAVKESRDRVRAAIKNCGFKYPTGRITVNLAPADKKKRALFMIFLFFLPFCRLQNSLKQLLMTRFLSARFP